MQWNRLHLRANLTNSGPLLTIKDRLTHLLARAASCDITPRDRPVRLAGYASRQTPASIVLDPIEISVVWLECAAQRCLIFSFDLMIVGSELQTMIMTRLQPLGFAAGEIVLLASHTHYAPATDRACARLGIPDVQFVDQLAAAAEDLVRQMLGAHPLDISWEVFQGHLEAFHQPAPQLALSHHWTHLWVEAQKRQHGTEPFGPPGRTGNRRAVT